MSDLAVAAPPRIDVVLSRPAGDEEMYLPFRTEDRR